MKGPTTVKGMNIYVKLAIIVVVIVIIYLIINAIVKNIKTAGQIKDFVSEQGQWEKKGEKLSYPLSEYKSMADKLYQAMDGIGTTNSAVYAVFDKVNNNMDFLELKKAFGVRDDENLTEWITGDMSESEINNINKKLTSKGIQYTI